MSVTKLGKLPIAKGQAHRIIKGHTVHMISVDSLYCFNGLCEFLTSEIFSQLPEEAREPPADGSGLKRLHLAHMNSAIASSGLARGTRVLHAGTLRTRKKKLKLKSDTAHEGEPSAV
jgi:hypothetical protein